MLLLLEAVALAQAFFAPLLPVLIICTCKQIGKVSCLLFLMMAFYYAGAKVYNMP
jgi:hypothetical protein